MLVTRFIASIAGTVENVSCRIKISIARLKARKAITQLKRMNGNSFRYASRWYRKQCYQTLPTWVLLVEGDLPILRICRLLNDTLIKLKLYFVETGYRILEFK